MTTLTSNAPLAEADRVDRFFSFGGGIQSVAAMVLAAQGRIDFTDFVFSNVGDDSEDPATLAYIEQHAKPFAETHGLRLHLVHKVMRDGTPETLFGRMTKQGSKSLTIPVHLSGGKPGRRSCTADFKIRVIGKWAKAHGASAEHPVTVGIGISLDEIQRANTRRAEPYEQIVYPLLDLRLRRADCFRIIRDAGLPIPPKSSCYFCPFRRVTGWIEMRRTRPEVFEKAASLEDFLNQRQALLGKDPVYLTGYGAPLRKVIPEGMQVLPADVVDDGGCDGGWCNT